MLHRKNDAIKDVVRGMIVESGLGYTHLYREYRKNPDHPSNIDGTTIKFYGLYNGSIKKFTKVQKKINKINVVTKASFNVTIMGPN